MRKSWNLKQASRNGKTKILTILVDEGSNVIERTWGLEGKKMQTSIKEVLGKNAGKANETTDHEQALKEAEAIATKKLREGYVDENDFKKDESEVEFTFDPLPSNLALSKPINDPPPDVSIRLGAPGYIAQRKYNGVNLLRVVDESGRNHIYTRTIRDITKIVANVNEIQDFIRNVPLPNKTISSFEFIFRDENDIELPKELRGIINEKTTEAKATDRYKRLSGFGSFHIKVFDKIFFNGQNMSKVDYEIRRNIMIHNVYAKDSKYEPWTKDSITPEDVNRAINDKWEGFVLRKKTGPESWIEYTMNGKPYRAGAWKFKFEWVDDYFIYEAKIGNSGRLAGKVAKFHLGKYDENMEIADCGWAGPGNIKTEELGEFATLLGINGDKRNVAYPTDLIVVEVKFRAKQPDTNSLEHPVIKYYRVEKSADECLIAGSPTLHMK